jgi:nicotinamide mononucleotide transporter
MSGDDFLSAVVITLQETDLITWIATVTAVIYVLLALKENIWCWSFGIISSGLSVGVYINATFYYEAVLNVLYVLLGIYGWVMWARRKPDAGEAPVTRIPPGELLLVCLTGVLAGLLLGYVGDRYTDSEFPSSDALLASFGVLATWMTAKKYIENWIFWVVIDAGSAVLYFFKGPSMYLFALLFIFYTFMAVAGYFAWKKSLNP